MGWLGGLGQGMMAYGDIMQKQKEMDWKSKENELANERKMNLEKLRASNNRELAEDKRDWTTSEREASQDFTATQLEGNKDSGYRDLETGRTISMKEYESTPEAERGKYQSFKELTEEQDAKKREVVLQGVRDQYNMKKELTQADATERAGKLRSFYEADGVISPTEEVLLYATENMLNPDELMGSRSKPISAEMLGKIDGMLQGDDKYFDADMGTKLDMIKEAHRRIQGKTTETEGGGGTSGNDLQVLLDAKKKGGKAWDNIAAYTKQQVGEAEYNKLMAQVEQLSPTEQGSSSGEGKSILRSVGDEVAGAAKGTAKWYNDLASGDRSKRAVERAKLKEQYPYKSDKFIENKLQEKIEKGEVY